MSRKRASTRTAQPHAIPSKTLCLFTYQASYKIKNTKTRAWNFFKIIQGYRSNHKSYRPKRNNKKKTNNKRYSVREQKKENFYMRISIKQLLTFSTHPIFLLAPSLPFHSQIIRIIKHKVTTNFRFTRTNKLTFDRIQ